MTVKTENYKMNKLILINSEEVLKNKNLHYEEIHYDELFVHYYLRIGKIGNNQKI